MSGWVVREMYSGGVALALEGTSEIIDHDTGTSLCEL
jgi:hypothetical protein